MAPPDWRCNGAPLSAAGGRLAGFYVREAPVKRRRARSIGRRRRARPGWRRVAAVVWNTDEEISLGRGARKSARWAKDRQRQKKARVKRSIEAGKAAAAAARK
jgi:hypothetical protein